MKEKRRFIRYAVEEMGITGKMMFATEVKINNISIGGASVTADRRLDIGREYNLKVIDQGNVFSVKGTVVWSNISGSRTGTNGESVPVYSAGIKFTDIMNQRISELLSFIDDHKEEKDDRLSGIRFRILEPERVILNIPHEYSVVKLSLGGMLIRCDRQLETELRYGMELMLPEEAPIKCIARIASCIEKKEGALSYFDTGVEFLEMEDADRQRLAVFISILNTLGKTSFD